jgi:putative ABC transport system permease protein
MSLWQRIANVFRGDAPSREIDEEFESHIAEAIEQGRDPEEARRAFGSPLHHRERSRDVRIMTWLDSLRADAVFGWRQLNKKKVTSAAAILSLALGIGACTSAFRLIDALLLRPLPVDHPERLYALSLQGGGGSNGQFRINDACTYPMFREMRSVVKDQAELIAISYADRIDLTYGSDQETERAYRQYISGWMFSSFGLQPELGRLFSEKDDLQPGAHPYAVITHDYWTRRFGQDPKVVGRTFRAGNDLFEIAGVVQAPFTGTEPGTATDIFIPTMMVKNDGIVRSDYRWFRTLMKLKPGAAIEPVREKLRAAFQSFLAESVKGFAGNPKQEIDWYLSQKLLVDPAPAGVSELQKDYRPALAALAVLVAVVLLIACANVANLMTAQAAARAREMALRVSIGAGRWRLTQLVLVESAMLATLAALFAALFSTWSVPFIVAKINPSDNPVRLALPADWRVWSLGLALAAGVTILFGLAPALRASGVKPAGVLKGGEDPHSRRRSMHALIALQVAFCFLVLFVAGMFVATSQRLSHQPMGFSAGRIVTLETLTAHPQPAAIWEQVAARLRATPGVEQVAISEWPLMTGESWNGFIAVNAAPPSGVPSYFLTVSAGWRNVMRIPLMGGRDFRSLEPSRVAMVNESFARQYFGGQNPIGKPFDQVDEQGRRYRSLIVGLVGDVRDRNMREPMQPIAFFPFQARYSRGWFVVRTSTDDPRVIESTLRQEVSRARSEFRVSNTRTETELIEAQTVRERLLAMLALFFAIVALLLVGVGLYGVLDYTVVQRRREIGIRMALGAQAANVARGVTVNVLAMVLLGSAAGLALGFAAARSIASLLYQVKATDAGMLAIPCVAMLAAASLAAIPAVIRAVRIDPVIALRSE